MELKEFEGLGQGDIVRVTGGDGSGRTVMVKTDEVAYSVRQVLVTHPHQWSVLRENRWVSFEMLSDLRIGDRIRGGLSSDQFIVVLDGCQDVLAVQALRHWKGQSLALTLACKARYIQRQ